MNHPPVEFFTYRHVFALWWHRQPEAWRTRQRRRVVRGAVVWAVCALVNLGAFLLTPLALTLGTRLFYAATLGPLGLLSFAAFAGGVPARFAFGVPAGLLALAVGALFVLGSKRVSPAEALRALNTDRAWHHAQTQGWLDDPHALADALALPDDTGLPYAVVPLHAAERGSAPVTLGSALDAEGHMLVAMMTGGGKGLHATATLGLHWPGAAIVVDPGGGILRQTYALRRMHPSGSPRPIYIVPQCDALDLGTLYNWQDPLDRTDLHRELIRPWKDHASVFAEKSIFVFDAVATYAAHHGLNPMDVLLGVASAPGMDGLIELARHAPGAVADFVGGRPSELDVHELQDNRFAQSAWDTFKLRMRDYVPHRDTLVYPTIPPDWAERGGTIYITYGLDHLRAIGGLISAGLAGLIKRHVARYSDQPVPLAIFCDELPSLGLGCGGALATWTATVRRSGIRFILYAQSRAQFDEVYPHEAEAILANVGTQVYGQPNEAGTAQTLSALFGTRIDLTYSGSQYANLNAHEVPRLSVGEIMNLGPTRVAVLTRDHSRAYRFVANRVDARERLATLPTISPPRTTLAERLVKCGLSASAAWRPPDASEEAHAAVLADVGSVTRAAVMRRTSEGGVPVAPGAQAVAEGIAPAARAVTPPPPPAGPRKTKTPANTNFPV